MTRNVIGFTYSSVLKFRVTVLNFDYVPLDCNSPANRPKPSTLQAQKHVAVKITESAKVWPKCKLIEFLGPCCSRFLMLKVSQDEPSKFISI